MLTKNDLEQIRGVVKEVVKTELRFEFEAQAVLLTHSFQEVQDQFTLVNHRVDRLYNLMDGFTVSVTRLDQEYTFIGEQLKRCPHITPA